MGRGPMGKPLPPPVDAASAPALPQLPRLLFQVRLVDKGLLKFLNLEELVLSANQIQEVDAVNLPPTLKVKEPGRVSELGRGGPRSSRRALSVGPSRSLPRDSPKEPEAGRDADSGPPVFTPAWVTVARRCR